MQKEICVEKDNLNFEPISEFKQSLFWGAEIEFEWKNVHYGAIRYGTDNKITICEATMPETEKICERRMKLWNTWLGKIAYKM